MTLSAAIEQSSGQLVRMRADREQLTQRLRELAAELDGLDRRLSDLLWRQRTGSELSRERTEVEARRDRLTSTLRCLAVELNNLDTTLEHWKGHQPNPVARVGTCPDCGYPSLDSGLCAFCRPRLAL